MPKIADVKSKSKSKRKPLRDVSNGGFKTSIGNFTVKKSNPDTQQEYPATTCGGDGDGGRDPLDQLLLVHSDLSAIIHQIDELIVQALEQKATHKKEVESFYHVLVEMKTSLKPWISRFQKLVPTRSSDNQLEASFASKKMAPMNDDMNKVLDSPDIRNLDFLVSPSPLVSWRADCAQEGGRNLFLLTPLPRPKPFSARLKESSKSIFEKKTSDATVAPMAENLNECVEVKPISGIMLSDHVDNQFSSPEKPLKRNDFMVVSTPCLKMSPPKSCILLEPISEYRNKNTGAGQRQDFESCNSQPSGHLGLKYPELFGIKPVHKLGNARKTVEASPNWCMSPPKTCVLLEPTDDLAPSNAVIKEVETNLPKAGGIHGIVSRSQVIDNTPMCKDLDTTILRGKRPGENTLKKELWTRFEAATTHGFRFKAPVDQETVNGGTNKGFMDLLEEVSRDDTNV